MSTGKNPRLRMRISASAEAELRSGHPWVFSNSIREQNREGQPGELAVIYDRKDRFLAIGLYDPDSPLRVRILHSGKPATLDAAWWCARFESAIERRRGILDSQTTGCRLIHGENDGWPGLVLDRYGEDLALKLYTAAWLPRLGDITELIVAALQPHRLILRLSRNVQDVAEKKFKFRDGSALHGVDSKAPSVFLETGLRFEANIVSGQKTGFFLDQRENRRKVESLAEGREVLNAFSFSGGFSLYAARGGAASVVDLDISPRALESAERNFELNQSDPSVAKCRHELAQGDAFDWLEKAARREFDLIVLDPPSFAKRESEKAAALQAYERLSGLGVERLKRAGVLVACSCSAHVSADEFFKAVRSAARKSGRAFQEMETTGHPPDHPATFREAQYLKAIYLRF